MNGLKIARDCLEFALRHREQSALKAKKMLEKQASSARLARNIAKLQKLGKPVPFHLRQALRDRTESSLDRLRYLLEKASDQADVQNKFERIGYDSADVKAKLDKLRTGLSLPKSSPLKATSDGRSLLSAFGRDFAEIRRQIPRNHWASTDDIADFKRYYRQVRAEQGIEPKNAPLNIHRRLLQAKGKELGSYGPNNRTARKRSTLLGGRQFASFGLGSQSRTNIFLHPVDDAAVDKVKKSLPPWNHSVNNDSIRRWLARNTLWHEGGHSLDPRLRAVDSNSPQALKDYPEAQREAFATLFENFSMFRKPGSQHNKFLQELAKANYANYPQGSLKAPPLPLTSFPLTEDTYGAANKLFQQLFK